MLSPRPGIRIREALAAHGYAVAGREELSAVNSDNSWQSLADDWDHLITDEYMSDGGRYRLRRFGRFWFLPTRMELHRMKHATVFQSATVNGFAGDIHRDFAPLREQTFTNSCLLALIRFDFCCFETVDPRALSDPWEVWVHQIRIEARDDQVGRPAPEGIHHDGHDCIAMHLVRRENVAGGTSFIYDNSRSPLHACMLERPMDTIYADDHRVMHNVEPIHPADARYPAKRDVLIIDYDHKPGLLKSE